MLQVRVWDRCVVDSDDMAIDLVTTVRENPVAGASVWFWYWYVAGDPKSYFSEVSEFEADWWDHFVTNADLRGDPWVWM